MDRLIQGQRKNAGTYIIILCHIVKLIIQVNANVKVQVSVNYTLETTRDGVTDLFFEKQ